MRMLVSVTERLLEPIFGDLPPLPKKVQEFLVRLLPLLCLALGAGQLVVAWYLWRLGHDTNAFVNYVNEVAQSYGATEAAVPSLNLFYWLDLVLLIVDAVLLLFAFPGLQARRKEGWELLLLAAVANLLYGIVALFDGGHGGFMKFFEAVLGSLSSFYFLYQLRSYYAGRHITHHEKHLPSIKDT